ncbi:hypothetical protein [Blastococcus atacamensis]|uniref:hypothetical protein n=1 Tax=Blastococcus atacamensis TaxID=2070508 RepID=UPI001E61D6D8|nr:hypothetical protein [Blastococcus atacamensis]
MRAVQITRFGGPEVLKVVDLPEPEAGDGQKLYAVTTAGINYADRHHPQQEWQTTPRTPGSSGLDHTGIAGNSTTTVRLLTSESG